MKEISRLQLITDDGEVARAACQAGVQWVQARIKTSEDSVWERQSREIVKVCEEFGATCIINDSPIIALKVGADGVHLGKSDMSPAEARKIVGPAMIIGGTANTFEDIQRLAAAGVDYIGLGPLRFTTTKNNLSPILGLFGVEQIMAKVRDAAITIPVIVIGGVAPTDLQLLSDFGVHGVAVSSAIAKAADVTNAAKSFLNQEAAVSL